MTSKGKPIDLHLRYFEPITNTTGKAFAQFLLDIQTFHCITWRMHLWKVWPGFPNEA